ncbi:MAG TPA: hypothetical protein VE969_05585 [Pyrinomonadaceae bacterium]|nr:hypothetical protein [Pyrinomonadaceae bacterium]
MIPRRLLFVSLAWALFFSFLLTPATSSQFGPLAQGVIRTLVLKARNGEVKVQLPANIAAGDTISGTVITEPKGKTEADKAKSAGELNGLVIEVGTQRWPVSGGVIKGLVIPSSLSRAPELILLDAQGRKLDRATLPVAPAQNIHTLPNFVIPELGRSGRPLLVPGPFDGDSSNTNVKIGVTDAKVIAESPRSAVVDVPKTTVGPSNINVNDNGNSASGSFRGLKIDLTAPKTSLLKGESTELHVEVQGLQGITQPVPIQIQNQTPQNINLTGGNTQNIIINPSQVSSSGTYNSSTGITGTGSGGFNITGTIPSTTTPPTTGPQLTATPSTPQTTSGGQTVPSGSPLTQPSGGPNGVPIAGKAKDLKKKCDELERKLNEARERCRRKKRECEELERKLAKAQQNATTAAAAYQAAKDKYEELLQSLLDSIRRVAAEQKFDWEFSLTKPDGSDGDNWASVSLDNGIVIWFAYPKGKDGKRQKMTKAEAERNGTTVKRFAAWDLNLNKKLKAAAGQLATADKNNREAQSALAEATAAVKKCKEELEKVCAEVTRLETELENCTKEQTEAERKEKEEANKPSGPKTSPPNKPSGPATGVPTPTPSTKPTQPAEDPVNKKLCEFCIKFMSAEGSSLTPEEANTLQDLAESLGMLDDALENAKGPASLLPLLKKLSAALKAAQASAEAINQLNDVIKQIEKLGAGGDDPANMGKFLKLVGGILSKVKGGGPLLQGLAFFFNQLGDLFDAVAALGDALATFRQMKQINAELRKYSCPQLLGMFLSALDKAKGDQDKALDDFIDSKFGALVRNDARLKEKVKQAILIRLRLCCLQKIFKECPKKK